ncbi:MAG: PRC-barrel domain-containing protein [Thermoplasmata archaeon]
MKTYEELEGREVLSSDGNLMGAVDDFTLTEDRQMDGMVVKINKKVIDELGMDKPLLSSLKMEIKLEHIKSVSDKVILNKSLDELYKYFVEEEFATELTSLIGREISDSAGTNVGEVEDILMDTETWGTPSILAKLDNSVLEDLDMKKALLSKTKIGISMGHVSDIGDVVMLDTTAEDMGKIIEKEPVKKV